MLLMGKLTISMAIFNSYFDITRGYCLVEPKHFLSRTWWDLTPRSAGGLIMSGWPADHRKTSSFYLSEVRGNHGSNLHSMFDFLFGTQEFETFSFSPLLSIFWACRIFTHTVDPTSAAPSPSCITVLFIDLTLRRFDHLCRFVWK